MAKVIDCPCGETIRGETEDETLDRAEQHVLNKHPDIAEQFERGTLAGMLRDE